jgi:hypothetical protein
VVGTHISVQIDGMLHLGALAIALTLGYIGLDKHIRGSVAELNPVSTEVRDTLENLLKRLDLVSTNLEAEDFLFPRYWTYIACVLAQQPYTAAFWRRVFYFVRRQKDLPLLGYFRSNVDMYVVPILCIACFVTFVSVADDGLWAAISITDIRIVRFIFILYLLTILWLIVSLVMLLKLVRNVQAVSNRSRDKLNFRADRIIGFKQHDARTAVEDQLKRPSPPP